MRCRAGASRALLVSSRIRDRSRIASSPRVNSFARAAASSSASGRPSSRRQISAIAAALAEVTLKSGWMRRTPATSIAAAGIAASRAGSAGVADVGQGQRVHRDLPLGTEEQPLPARHEQPEPGTRAQRRDQVGSRGQHVLAVVDHEQQLLAGQRTAHAAGQRAAWRVAQAEGPRDLRDHHAGIADRGEVDEHDPVVEPEGHRAGGGDGEPGLADAGRPGQREQAGVGSGQRAFQVGELGLAADKRQRRVKQVAGT